MALANSPPHKKSISSSSSTSGTATTSSSAAVVAIPNDRWGETPCAFIELKDGFEISADQLRDWCQKYLAGFKLPSLFIFGPIKKTSTGKIQKAQLRNQAIDFIQTHSLSK